MAKQALPGKRINAFGMDPDDLVIIGLDTDDGPDHPRYDERVELPLKEETVLNMMVIGVQEAAVVQKVDGKPIVVNGRRRVMHAREANRRLRAQGDEPIVVKVMVAKGDEDLMDMLQISLNEHREDDPIKTKIDKCVRMLARNGGDIGKAAVSFGVTPQTIRSWMKVAEASTSVRKAVERGQISMTAASKLAVLDRADQKEELDKLLESGVKPTVAAADAAAKTRKSTNNGGAPVNPAPTKRVLRKVVESFSKREDTELDPEFVRGVRWAIGDLDAAAVKGLKDVLSEL